MISDIFFYYVVFGTLFTVYEFSYYAIARMGLISGIKVHLLALILIILRILAWPLYLFSFIFTRKGQKQ